MSQDDATLAASTKHAPKIGETHSDNLQQAERGMQEVSNQILLAQADPKKDQQRPEAGWPKPENMDKGIDSITILRAGTLFEYKPGSRDDRLASRVERVINGVFTTDLTFFDGRPDGLKHKSIIKDAAKTQETKEYQNNKDGIKKETVESDVNDALNGLVTRHMQDGTRIEFDKRNGQLIRSRKFDINGDLLPAEHEVSTPVLNANKLVNRVVVDSSTGTPDHVQRVQEQVDKIPEPVRKLLNDHGVKIIAADKVVDARPDLANTQPRGYPAGTTYENTSAISDYSKKQIIIGDEYKDKGQWYHDNRVESVTRHEVGHAVDAILGQGQFGWGSPISESVDFQKAYDADVAKIPIADRDKLEYLLQPGDGGKSETFAEVYANIQGGAATADPVARALIGKYFTDTEKFVRDKLANL